MENWLSKKYDKYIIDILINNPSNRYLYHGLNFGRYAYSYSHWKPRNVMPTLSALIIVATCGSTTEDKVGIMTTLVLPGVQKLPFVSLGITGIPLNFFMHITLYFLYSTIPSITNYTQPCHQCGYTPYVFVGNTWYPNTIAINERQASQTCDLTVFEC